MKVVIHPWPLPLVFLAEIQTETKIITNLKLIQKGNTKIQWLKFIYFTQPNKKNRFKFSISGYQSSSLQATGSTQLIPCLLNLSPHIMSNILTGCLHKSGTQSPATIHTSNYHYAKVCFRTMPKGTTFI